MTGARRSLLAPTALLFGIMVAHALLETARDALFLARLGPHRLASAYLTIAAVAMLAVAVTRHFTTMRDPRRMLQLFLAVAVTGTSALALAIPHVQSLVFVLYVWTGLVATLVVPSFWTLIDRTLLVAEAKRTFATIGAGGVLGAMVGSALASALGHLVAATDIVGVGGIAFAVTLVATVVLAPRAQADELPRGSTHAEVASRTSRRYVELLVVVGVVSTVALTLADLTFKRVISERFPAADLVTTFGAIYTVLNLIGLVIQLLVTSRLLSRWGVGTALIVLPLLIVSTATGFAMTGALIAVLALKVADGGLRHSLHRVTSEVMYVPVPPMVRDGWKPVADAISQRGGQALAALLTFAIATLSSGAQLLAVAVAGAAVAWLLAIRVARRAYAELVDVTSEQM
jgi:ATP/ADP translocase